MKLSLTKRKILGQLQENTGSAMCDSGGAYGRNHERNQGKTWEDLTKDPCTLEASVYAGKLELSGTVSLAAYMENNLTYDPALQRAFKTWCTAHPDEYELAWMEGFAQWHDKNARVVNSYNGECDLTQTVQFVEFEWGEYDDRYVLWQVHGGCDVRGGYTSPVAYKLRDGCDGIGDWCVGTYWCNLGHGKSWDSEGTDCGEYLGPNLFTGYTTGEVDGATDIVVKDHKAYFRGEEIFGMCYGLEGVV